MLVLDLSAQVGFNKPYDLEPEIQANTFSNILIDDDTIVLFGVAIDAVGNQQGLSFVKMDTLGNIITSKFHLSPLGENINFAASPNHSLIKTNDGGYALVGSVFDTKTKGVFVKLDKTGDLEQYKIYESPYNTIYRHIIEVQEGYIITGQKTTSSTFILVKKINQEGITIWESTVGEPGLFNYTGSLLELSNSLFIIGAGKASNIDPPSTSAWGRSQTYLVDSSGLSNISFTSPQNVQTGIVGLNHIPNGWIYGSRTYETFSGDWGANIKLIRTDENFNVIWEKVISPTRTSSNTIVDIKPTPDGNWIAVGNWSTPLPTPPEFGNYLGGFTYKFKPNGDSIWCRVDSLFQNGQCASRNYMGGVGVLKSGSIVAAGYNNRDCVPPYRSYGWVLKVNSNGCLDTLCNDLLHVNNLLIRDDLENGIKLFPNPIEDFAILKLNTELPFNSNIFIYNQFGKVLKVIPHNFEQGKNLIQIDLSNILTNGIFFISISNITKTYFTKGVKF
jgi:hypothetical protein